MSNLAATTSEYFSWNFSQGDGGWQGGFADYPQGEENFYELDWGSRSLPSTLGNDSALWINGHNRSDDLFMYSGNSVTGLAPNTTYNINFNVEVASNAPKDSFGIGGSPAHSVYLKAGATLVEPSAIITDPSVNFLEMNVDKGQQSQGGEDGIVLGDMAKLDNDNWDYALISRHNNGQSFRFTTDSTGNAWLYFGTDSGYEGLTSLYYTKFSAEFTPISSTVPEPTGVYCLLGFGLGIFGLWLTKRFSYCRVK